MKYASLDLGTIEAVFNKLGGMEAGINHPALFMLTGGLPRIIRSNARVSLL